MQNRDPTPKDGFRERSPRRPRDGRHEHRPGATPLKGTDCSRHARKHILVKFPNYLQARPPQGRGAQQMHNKDPTPKNGEKRARWAGALDPDPWNRAPAREANPAKRTRSPTGRRAESRDPAEAPFPSAQPPKKGRLLPARCSVTGGRSREETVLPPSPRRCLLCWQHMPRVGCLMELQAGLARSVATQERSPGALARRNPEEASFYKLPVRRLHRGIGETRAW